MIIEDLSKPSFQRPSVGRVVHYTAADGNVGPYAGIITAVASEDVAPGCHVVDLATLGRHSLYFNHNVPYDADGGPNTWRYPPRVS